MLHVFCGILYDFELADDLKIKCCLWTIASAVGVSIIGLIQRSDRLVGFLDEITNIFGYQGDMFGLLLGTGSTQPSIKCPFLM